VSKPLPYDLAKLATRAIWDASHRAAPGKAKLLEAIETTRKILGIPA